VVLLLVTSRPRTMSALGGGSAAGPSHSRRSRRRKVKDRHFTRRRFAWELLGSAGEARNLITPRSAARRRHATRVAWPAPAGAKPRPVTTRADATPPCRSCAVPPGPSRSWLFEPRFFRGRAWRRRGVFCTRLQLTPPCGSMWSAIVAGIARPSRRQEAQNGSIISLMLCTLAVAVELRPIGRAAVDGFGAHGKIPPWSPSPRKSPEWRSYRLHFVAALASCLS
jgi:hypothetical protein